MDFSNGINALKESYGKGRKMLSVMDILDLNPIRYENIRNSVEVKKDIENKNRVEKGDLVFVRSSEVVEEVGWSKAYLENKYALYSGFTIRGKKKNEYDARFIELNLNSSSRKQIQRKAGGSTRFNVSQSILKSIVIRVTSIEEQTKIGDFFKKLDETIVIQEQELTALKQTKQGFLQKMFPKEGESVPEIRFPGFTEGWEVLKLEELLEERNEQMPENEEFPLMSFTATEGVIPKSDRYNRGFLVKSTNKKYKKTEKDVRIYSSHNLEVGAMGLNNTGKAVISPVYSIFHVKENITSDFMGMLIQRKEFINKMLRYRQGVVYGQWRIHESDFLNIETLIPSNAEQHKIGSFFRKIDDTIILHEHELEILKQTKKAFL